MRVPSRCARIGPQSSGGAWRAAGGADFPQARGTLAAVLQPRSVEGVHRVNTLTWVVVSAVAMSAIAWVGLVTVALNEDQLKKLLLPLVAFAAGSLLAGALLHLLPEAVEARGAGLGTFVPVLGGFALFFLIVQFLAWHHGHSLQPESKQPVTYLILLADGLHNFIGGMAIAASFIVSTQVGIVTWIAAAAHEVPQELGDFGILIRGGWGRGQALAANFISAATIVHGVSIHPDRSVGQRHGCLQAAIDEERFVRDQDVCDEVAHVEAIELHQYR